MIPVLLASLLCIFGLHGVMENPIVIVTASYNNAQWYQHNANSVFTQKYHNYHWIYV